MRLKYNGIYQVGEKYWFKRNIPASYYDWYCLHSYLKGEGFNVLYMIEDSSPQESFWWIAFDDFLDAFDFQMKYMV